MRGYMFRNRLGALLFVGGTAVAAAALIGGEQDEGMLLSAAEEIKQQRAAMAGTMTADTLPAFEIPTSEVVEFTPDEALIDEATGYDPTPLEDGVALETEVVPQDEVVIVSRDDRQGGS